MCYYSTTLHSSKFRAAKEGEDLTLHADGRGHHYPVGGDGKIVCMLPGTEIHIENFQLNPEFVGSLPHMLRYRLEMYVGKPLSAQFWEYHTGHGHAADCIKLGGERVHMLYLKAGTKFYIGAKRPSLETKLGVGDPPTIREPLPSDETPTLQRMLQKVVGLCSVTP